MKKSNFFCKLKTVLSRKFVYNLQTFRGFFKCVFTIFLQIQQENNFPPTSKHWQGESRRFLGICLYDCYIYRSKNVSKRDAIFAPVAKQWITKDIPGYGSQSKRAKIAIHLFGKY